ncbi:glycoside hydrolase family 27 protein [Kitasatospora sp. NBC_00240]|uniref:hypothetical protein n=1 Tax=Kitasatospora sp. NBC_00240 TaxID=2903567 RepID=UPI0022532E5C|nr:hypothetical protein [Kitasatospora sp. NBC_00240]MCX5208382.1 glycoside hydrolase family 27 protein [Kitasatospora sp. NBC_00240]
MSLASAPSNRPDPATAGFPAPPARTARPVRRIASLALSAAILVTGSLAVTAVSAPTPAEAMVPPGAIGATTPPMGWNSWYFFNNNITAKAIADQAAGLATPNANLALTGTGTHKSLADLGYRDVSIDGGWWTGSGSGRDASGTIVPNAGFLPSGAMSKAVTLSNGTTVPAHALNTMKDLTDYVHALGLKAGMYTDTGTTGCGGQRGSGNNEAKDVTTFADWGYDWVKVDHCGGTPTKYGTVMADYKDWGSLTANAKSSAGVAHPLALEICEWGTGAPDGPWVWGGAASRTWRTGRDITGAAGYGTTSNGGSTWINWSQVQGNFNLNDHPSNEGPGQYNDPDYLLIGPGFGDNPATGQQQTHGTDTTLWGLTPDEQQSYFGMWAIQGAPLVLATDTPNLTAASAAIVGNESVIAVDQDSAVHQGQKVIDNGNVQVWSKQLATAGTRAVLLLNTSSTSQTYSFTTQNLGLNGTATVQNLYTGAGLGTLSSTGSKSFTLAPHQSVMLKLTGATEQKPETVFAPTATGISQKSWNGSTWSGWQTLALGTAGSTGPGSIQGEPAVVSSAGGVDVFVRGTDNALWANTYKNGAWGSWVNLGGTLSASPTAASLGRDRIDVFVRSTDGKVYQKTFQQTPGASDLPAYWYDVKWTTSWVGQDAPNATTIVGAPTAVASLNRIDLFARGTDNALWQKSYVSGEWTGWTKRGGTLSSSPTAVSGHPGQIEVFAALSPTGNIGQLSWTATGGWSSTWYDLGRAGTGAPTASQVGDRINVYIRATDNTLWQWYRIGTGPTGTWQQLDSTTKLTGNPAAAAHP